MNSADLITQLATAPAPGRATALRNRVKNTPDRPVMRAVHHLACTGGTLIARAIAAQAQVILLSEIDPFTTMMQSAKFYAPTDLIQSARRTPRALADDITGQMFVASLTALTNGLESRGQMAVLRGHAHSQFCTRVDPASRPALNTLLDTAFAARQIVTLRHPLDAYLALTKNGWLHFDPATLEEYACRHLAFLDSTAGLPQVFYEDFVADPDGVLGRMLVALDIPLTPRWQRHMAGQPLTGDSGRSGAAIAPRPRRAVPDDLAAQARSSESYAALCDTLGYAPDPAAPARG